MPRHSRSHNALPAPVVQQFEKLGKDIAIARKRRRISMKSMAERMMVSLETVQRLEDFARALRGLTGDDDGAHSLGATIFRGTVDVVDGPHHRAASIASARPPKEALGRV